MAVYPTITIALCSMVTSLYLFSQSLSGFPGARSSSGVLEINTNHALPLSKTRTVVPQQQTVLQQLDQRECITLIHPIFNSNIRERLFFATSIKNTETTKLIEDQWRRHRYLTSDAGRLGQLEVS